MKSRSKLTKSEIPIPPQTTESIPQDDVQVLKQPLLSDSALESIKVAWPICLGYFPLGFAFGVLAQKAGLDSLDIALMSILVYAGSSQFIAVAMLSVGAAPVSIILTTFIVNLRHMMMSSSLAVYLHGTGRRFLSIFAYGVALRMRASRSIWSNSEKVHGTAIKPWPSTKWLILPG